MAVGSRNPAVGGGGGGTNNYYTTTEIISGVTMNIVDASAGEVVLTLPSAGANANSTYKIYKADSSANRVIVTGTDPIYGDTILTKQYESLHMTSDSTSWWGVTQQEPGVNVRVFGATGNGTDDDRAAVNTAAGIAAGNNLIFPAGTYRLSSNLTLDENLVPHKGAIFSLDFGVVLTISGTITAGRYQIFAGAGTVSFTGNQPEVYPEWWRGLPDDSIDDTAAIQAALNAIQANGGKMSFGVGTYELNNAVPVYVHDNTTVEGVTGSKIKVYSDPVGNDAIAFRPYGGAVSNVTFRNIEFFGIYTYGAEYIRVNGIYGAFSNTTIEGCTFRNLGTYAIRVSGGDNVHIHGNYFVDLPLWGIESQTGVEHLIIENNIFDDVVYPINIEPGADDVGIEQFIISNNVIETPANHSDGHGINIRTRANIAGSGYANHRDCIVSNNIVTGTLRGISVDAYNGVMINGNMVIGALEEGIIVAISHDNTVNIIGNTVLNCGISLSRQRGIYISGDGKANLVGNRCFDMQETPTQLLGFTYTNNPTIYQTGNFFSDYYDYAAQIDDVENAFATSGGANDGLYYAFKFTATKSENISSIWVDLKKVGSPVGTISAYIYSDSTGPDNALNHPNSVSRSISTDITDQGLYQFNFQYDIPVTNGIDYWCVLMTAGYTRTDGVDELMFVCSNDGAGTCMKYQTVGGWTTITLSAINYKIEYADLSIDTERYARISSGNVARGNALLQIQRGTDGKDFAGVSFGEYGDIDGNFFIGHIYNGGYAASGLHISKSPIYHDSAGVIRDTPYVSIGTTGDVGINAVAPTRKLEVIDSSNPQFRLSHTTTTKYTDFQTDTSGYMTITPSGSAVIVTGLLLGVTGASGLDGATPVTLRVRSSSEGTWVSGSIMAKLDFYSDDTSGGNAGVRTSIKDVVEDTYGADHGLAFYTTTAGAGAITEQMRINNIGSVGINIVAPTAKLHLPAGTATVNTAPLKLTSGTVLGTPEAGAIEFNNDSLYYTKTTGPTRMTIAPLESPSFTTPNIGVATATSVSCSPTISSGAGAPGTTPAKVGDIYVDTTGKKMYAATGITNSTDWTIVN